MFTARELVVSTALWGVVVAVLVGTTPWSVAIAVVAIIAAAVFFDWLFRAPAPNDKRAPAE